MWESLWGLGFDAYGDISPRLRMRVIDCDTRSLKTDVNRHAAEELWLTYLLSCEYLSPLLESDIITSSWLKMIY